MSGNPFLEGKSSAFYSDFVKDQISSLEVEDSTKVDIGGKTKEAFRAALAYSSASLGIKLKTKSGDDGELWVKRIR